MRNRSLVSKVHSKALLQSLLEAPLLVDDLRLSSTFDRSLLSCGAIKDDQEELDFNQKLGHLYEDALGLLLRKSEKLDLLAMSLQIFDENKLTKGELDYLVRVEERVIHLELAVKFYLIYEEDGVVSYPGPDPRDNWDNKLARLESHQLGMARSEYGKKLLSEKFGVDEVEVQHLIYGRLFKHFSSTLKDADLLPRAVKQGTIIYLWIYYSEWDTYLNELKMYRIPKSLWPLGLAQFDKDLLETLEVMTKGEILKSMEEYASCQMVWSSELQQPLFLVPDGWPNAYE